MKFSIIMPVFNAAPYLRDCLDSIIAQTVKDFECVCVNDGSTDGGDVILDEYAKRDSRIKVFHQENKGVAAARQLGLDSSKGAWITWVDPDDWVDSDMLEQFEKFLIYNPCEMVWSDYWVHETACTYKVDSDFPEDAIILVREALEGRFMGVVWMKMFARSLIERARADFPNYYVTCWEDLYFVLKCLMATPRVGHMKSAFYHYMIRDASPIHLCKPAGVASKCKLIADMEKIACLPVLTDVHRRRKQGMKIMACMNPLVSNKEWQVVFPEILSLDGFPCKWHMRIMFKLSMKGFRTPALAAYLVGSRVKKLFKFAGRVLTNSQTHNFSVLFT